MKVYVETERLILREIVDKDVDALFKIDSDAEVHRYLGSSPIQTLAQAQQIITFIRSQYLNFGIARWAAIEKTTGNFTGWCGLKLITDTYNNHTNFYDIGYRFSKQYWGKGYATESASAAINYGFEVMKLSTINGMADVENAGSNHVLRKIGLGFINEFEHHGDKMNWFEITK